MSTLSRNAEVELVNVLLDFEYFGDPETQRLLSHYPFASYSQKMDLICKLMHSFWSSTIKTDIFPVFKDFDTFLIASGRRGHFVHQFEVFLLGLDLIRRLFDKAEDPQSSFGFTDPYKVFFTWLLTATSHDFGRPLEVASMIANKLSALYKGLGMEVLSSQYGHLPEKNLLQGENELRSVGLESDSKKNVDLALNLDSVISNSIRDSLAIEEEDARRINAVLRKEDNHGYVSAAVLCRSAMTFLVQDKSFQDISQSWVYSSLKTAIGAIALHSLHGVTDKDIQGFIKQIDFNLNAYAFVLFLIDNIQDWSRPFANVQDYPEYNLVGFSYSGDEVRLDYILTHDDWTSDMKEEANNYLVTKRELLQAPKGPEPSLGIEVRVTFESNEGESFTQVQVAL